MSLSPLVQVGIGFGGTVLTMVAAPLSRIVLGGFKIGRLPRTVTASVSRAALPGFLLQLQNRLLELGFVQREGEGACFSQRGQQTGELESLTHAKAAKTLTWTVRNPDDAQVTIAITLQYDELIVADTGEGAYRDAVLEYVCGRTSQMHVVPNQSFAAYSCLVGGAISAAAALLSLKIAPQQFWLALLFQGAVNVIFGVSAVKAIRARPNEIKGAGLAVTGIVLSSVAALAVAALALPDAIDEFSHWIQQKTRKFPHKGSPK